MIGDVTPPPLVVFPVDWNARCGPMAGAPRWATGVYHDDGTIEIRFDACAAIVKAQTGRMRTRADVRAAAAAVMVVAHEVSHKAGTHDAAVTAGGENSAEPDCVAWLLYPWVARKLGLRRPTVERLASWALAWGQQSCQKAGVS